MKFYRVHQTVDHGSSAGFEFFTNEKEAHHYAAKLRRDDTRSDAEINEIDITPTKAGILSALNLYASHPDNG